MAEKESLLNSLLGLSMIVEARDPYTGGHLWRVSQFSKLLAQHVGLSRRDVALSEVGGFLHDLGKVGVPDAILNKPDRLTDGEYDVIKTHPAVGGKLLSRCRVTLR
jgi:HD-GYP domain-containing protein (c-di-GMP phosphodiesterase class II)